MKRVLIITCAAMVAVCACKHKPAVQNDGKTECVVYEGWPVHHGADFEIEAVFIPVDQEGMHAAGDTVWINDDGFIVDFPIRDAETKQPFTDNLYRVILHTDTLHKRVKIN